MNTQEEYIHAEQVRLLYNQTLTAVIGNPMGAAIFCWIFWNVINHKIIIIWCSCMILYSMIRLFPFINYKRHEERKTSQQWGNIYLFMTFIQGSLWGIATLIFIPTEDPIYNVIVSMWIVGVSAAAIGAYSAYIRAMLTFFLPVVVPGTLHLFLLNGQLNIALGLGICAYAFIVLRTIIPVNKAIINSIQLNFVLDKQIKQRKNIEDKLREVSIRDELTGLFNRRYFNEVLQNELKRAHRNSTPLSLILIDIDYFKSFNDTYGHLEGDTCLQLIGNTLNQSVKRPGDIVARYGGEELVIILPDTKSDNAFKMAEQIRKDIQALNIPHTGSDIDELNVITISAGVTTVIPKTDLKPEDIIQKADNALYKAKHQGRNQTVLIDHE